VALVGRALLLAAVWLSPAAIVGATALLLADGTRGLFTPVVLGGGAVLASAGLGGPWSRLAGASSLVGLMRHRWPARPFVTGVLEIPGAIVAFLFVWAQLAAWREVAETQRWSPTGAVALMAALLVLALWREAIGRWLATSGAGVAGGGLALALVVVMAVTDPAWPRVWVEVVGRARMVFLRESPWTDSGQPVSGAGPVLWMSVTEEHRMRLAGRGPVVLERGDGTSSRRDVRSDTEVILHAGDRLGVPNGFRVRFEPARAVPGAPPSGAAWLDPAGARGDWRSLAGLGLTLLVGAIGLAPAHVVLAAGPAAGPGAARLGAAFVVLGGLGVALWTLYAVWLTPEIYTGGAVAFEVYQLPGRLRTLGEAAGFLESLVVLAFAGGGVAASWAALAALAATADRLGGRMAAALVLAVAAALVLVAPVRSWSLLLAAFGLAASGLGPAAVLVCWREGLSARAVALGAGVGGFLFVTLWALSGVPARGAGAASWLAWLAAWPAVLAVPANIVAAWLASPSAGRRASPPDLAALHGDG
jgi:hypothetical protein